MVPQGELVLKSKVYFQMVVQDLKYSPRAIEISSLVV